MTNAIQTILNRLDALQLELAAQGTAVAAQLDRAVNAIFERSGLADLMSV